MEYKVGDIVRVLKPEQLKKEWYEYRINAFESSKVYIEKIFKGHTYTKNEWIIKEIQYDMNAWETKYIIENDSVRGYSVYKEEIKSIFGVNLPDHLFEI